MAEIYIDAENAIVGRIGAYAAKKALLGDTIKILNSEKAIITGNKKDIIHKYYTIRNKVGQPQKGPFVPRMPDRFFRRIIRGMLPYKRERGRLAFDRIMCYLGVPAEFKDKKLQKVPGAEAGKLKTIKFTKVEEVCKLI